MSPWMSGLEVQLSGATFPLYSTIRHTGKCGFHAVLHMPSLSCPKKRGSLYKCDGPYDRGSEMSIRWNDPDINIDWPVEHPLLSEKDAAAPLLRDLMDRLPRYTD